MNWAWRQKLSPTPKLILMALADAANDTGVCWPSVSTLATKCCVSVRTVRRVLQKLVERGLMISEQRYRGDGCCASNRYRLLLERGDKLSPAPDECDTTPCHGCEGPTDAGGIPGTTTGPRKESLQPPEKVTEAGASTSMEVGGGQSFHLYYPKALSVAEQEEAGRKLAGISNSLAQQLLDELAAGMEARVIQKSPLAYLRGLIARARAGTFTPEGAFRTADARKRRAQIDAEMRSREVEQCDYPLGAVDPADPLIRRLLELQDKAREKRGESG